MCEKELEISRDEFLGGLTSKHVPKHQYLEEG